jgi:prepilin-type N-terminal cleavage/methylation domain-containing protein
MKTAFTLVELLVVITIIVVLLALLTPAMDQALYQAELAVCAAGQNATAKGVNIYAMDFKRSYPYRRIVAQGQEDTSGNVVPWVLNFGSAGAAQGAGRSDGSNDDRVPLKSYVDMKLLVDPLCKKVDLAAPDSTIWIYSSYALWFGWNYKGHEGMTKVGNRLTWADTSDTPTITRQVNWLITDLDDVAPSLQWNIGGHPDALGFLHNAAVESGGSDNPNPLAQANNEISSVTASWWVWWQGWDRGEIDMNAAAADGSVTRYARVRSYDDERMGRAPVTPGIDYPVSAYPTRDGGSASVPNRWLNIPVR